MVAVLVPVAEDAARQRSIEGETISAVDLVELVDIPDVEGVVVVGGHQGVARRSSIIEKVGPGYDGVGYIALKQDAVQRSVAAFDRVIEEGEAVKSRVTPAADDHPVLRWIVNPVELDIDCVVIFTVN